MKEKIVEKFKNITLVGMPGSGKSTLGKGVAARYGMEFIDMDDYFALKEGKGAGECILTEGEPAFRKKESDYLKEVLEREGIVVATGGGVVLAKENRELLKRRSIVIHVKRPLENLATDGRPISAREGVKAIAQKRAPLYAEVENIPVLNIQDKDTTVDNICNSLAKLV